MPDIYPLESPEPGAALGWDGADYRVPKVDTDHHPQVDVLSSALPAGAATQATLAAILAELLTHTLPTGAATEATLAQILTAAQLIDDLRGALLSVATDQLRAAVVSSALPAGAATQATLAALLTELQTLNLQHFNSVWRFTGSAAGGAGDLDVDSPVLVAPDLVVVQNAMCWLSAGSCASMTIAAFDGAVVYGVARLAAPAVDVVLPLPSPMVLTAGERLRFRAFTVGAGTTFQGRAVGYYVST